MRSVIGKLPLISVVVPTFNEAGNVERLLEELDTALSREQWEVLFVDDDSVDHTREILRGHAQTYPLRIIHRVGRRGLASAVVEGVMAAMGEIIVVMDADLQHDPAIVPKMVAPIVSGDAQITVGSRFAGQNRPEGLSEARNILSKLGNGLSTRLIKRRLTDPLSGFFAVRRELFVAQAPQLSVRGYKILLDLLSTFPPSTKVKDVAMPFRKRPSGESKLGGRVVLEFALMLGDKTIGRILPLRFILFTLVGLGGAALHLTLLALTHKGMGLAFLPAQFLATLFAMLFNFHANNSISYRDMKLKGKKYFQGMLVFALLCSVGAVLNLVVAESLIKNQITWQVAGIVGAIVGGLWNYSATFSFGWAQLTGTRQR